MSTPFHRGVPHTILIFHQLSQHYKALIITTTAMTQQQSSMMRDHTWSPIFTGDHSNENEETEYPTNSVVDDGGDIVVPTLPPLPTEEEQDIWRGYLLIFFFDFFPWRCVLCAEKL
jgi:hypothetical protein